MSAPKKLTLTPEQTAEVHRRQALADEASARGEHDAAASAGHRAVSYVLSAVRSVLSKRGKR
jgi:hypothetical protein